MFLRTQEIIKKCPDEFAGTALVGTTTRADPRLQDESIITNEFSETEIVILGGVLLILAKC